MQQLFSIEAVHDDHPARGRLRQLALGPDDALDLAEASLLVAAEEYAGLDVAAYCARLDALANELRPRLANLHGPVERLQELTKFLHSEQQFRGNVTDYYDPRNSFLNEVLERRVGIPITLAVVYIEVGRRVGVHLAGTRFPGHFLLRHVGEIAAEIFIDPFSPEHLMSGADCKKLLSSMTDGKISFDPAYLTATSARQIVVRLINNLKLIYLRSSDLERALGCVDRILMLSPETLTEYRDRGVIYLQMEAFRAALADLSLYLPHAAEGEEKQMLTYLTAQLRGRVEMLN